MRRNTISSLLATLFVLTAASAANAQIKSPGRHAHYAAELEPHLVYQWSSREYLADDGIGLGFRASIPLIEDGPVRTINNSMAITFGLDWATFDDCGRFNDVCDANEFWVPVAVQWNFFLTESISLFPELGLAIQHARVDWDGVVPIACDRRNNWCVGDDTDTDLELVLWFGARFGVSDDIALTLRLGTPSLLFGVSFLL